MRSRGSVLLAVPIAAGLLVGCDAKMPIAPSLEPAVASAAKGGIRSASTFAARTTLPTLSRNVSGEAYAVDQAGSIVAGYSWDRAGRMNPVTWTLLNGTWTIAALPYSATATSAVARAVNDQGDVAGNDFPASTPHAVLWPHTGGFNLLGCGELGEVYGLSAAGRIAVGIGRGASPVTAAVWEPGICRSDLPPLVAGGAATALAVNGDGAIVGGSAAPDAQSTFNVPVRWRRVAGAWQIDLLDARAGSVRGANSLGDLVGTVEVSCASASSCSRGVIWYAAGGSRELGTLGGESTTPRGINAVGEVVGLSTLPNGDGTAFFWAETLGMRQLPVNGGAWAFAVSGVRPDGTRLVVGAGGKPAAPLAWVVSNP